MLWNIMHPHCNAVIINDDKVEDTVVVVVLDGEGQDADNIFNKCDKVYLRYYVNYFMYKRSLSLRSAIT